MILSPARLRPMPTLLLPFAASTSCRQARLLHARIARPPIPDPTPFVPDVQTFLTLIGRNLGQHATKISSWKALFSLTTAQLRELGVEPPRSRRYLLRWREKYRNGQYGIGGDAQHVENGVAEFRVAQIEVPDHHDARATLSPGKRKVVVNVSPGGSAREKSAEQLVSVKGLHIKGAYTIVGPKVQPIKGGKGAKIVVKEGLWEDRRGHKVDGGERRQGEVRAKRRSEERRAMRERQV